MIMNKKNILQENKKIRSLMLISEAAELGGIKQLIYNPLGYGYTNGKKLSGFKVAGHNNHLHIGFTNKDVAIKIMDKSMSMGLTTSENPYTIGKKNGDPTGKLERSVHVSNSAHLSNFPGSPKVGMGVDISGDPNKIKELVSWIESKFGGTATTSLINSRDKGIVSDFADEVESDFDSTNQSDSGSVETDDRYNFLDLMLSPVKNALGLVKSKKDDEQNKDVEQNKQEEKENLMVNKKGIYEEFTIPVEKTRDISFDKKTVLIPTLKDREVKCPNDGKILSVNDKECDGEIKIKTEFEDKEYIIVLCGVDIAVSQGMKVSKNQKLGYTKNKELKMEIINKTTGSKEKISKFLVASDSKNDQGDDDNKKTSKSDLKPIDISKIPGELRVLPFKAAEYVVKNVYKNIGDHAKKGLQDKGKSEELNEEISRIKKLMK